MLKNSRRTRGKTLLACTVVTAMIAAVVACFWATGLAHFDGGPGGGEDPLNPGHPDHDALDPSLIPPGTWIVGTDHDFDYLVDVAGGEQGCLVCHDGPIWNHTTTAVPGTQDAYETSDTTGTTDPQPGEYSLYCLDCHDGTVRIDDFGGSAGGLEGPMDPNDDEYFGTNLRHHHPVGIDYATLDAGTQMYGINETNRYGGKPSDLLIGGKVECMSCHDPHTNAQEDNPDNDPGKYSHVHTWGSFVKLEGLCFQCHKRYQNDVDPSLPYGQRKVSPYADAHHFPGRDDPWGEDRGVVPPDGTRPLEFACSHCHDIDGASFVAPGDPHNSPCVDCHTTWNPLTQDSPAVAPASHHGLTGQRSEPLINCAICHADPETGLLTGAPFGIHTTPSCGSCHMDEWSEPVFSVDGGGPYTGEVGDTTVLTASFTLPASPSEGDTLTASWNLGDGTPPGFPSSITFAGGDWDGDLTISHVFPVGVTNGSVILANGVDPPVTDTFQVTITDPGAPTADSWAVDADVETDFEITFEAAAGGVGGVFTAVRDGTSVAFGIEAAGTIFWFDMEFTTEYWGVGSTYFGNINRGAGTMSGVIITSAAGIDTFTAAKN